MSGNGNTKLSEEPEKQRWIDKGLPQTPPLETPVLVYTMLTLGLFGAGQGVAWAVYFAHDVSNTNAKIDAMAKLDLGWLFLMAVLLKNAWWFINSQQYYYRTCRGVNMITPDQHIYKIMGQETNTPYIMMEQEGAIGKWNRAQRATMNFLECYPSIALLGFSAGSVFPRAAFGIVACFIALRMTSARKYAEAYDDRLSTWLLSMLCLSSLEGLALILGVKAVLRA